MAVPSDSSDATSTARPRPRPAGETDAALSEARSSYGSATVGSRPARSSRRSRTRFGGTAIARVEPASPAQVVGAAGHALVTAGRVGRLLSRSGMRIARQMPGVALVESQAQRIGLVAASEFNRLLQIPQQLTTSPSDEQRVMTLVQDAHHDPEPLRTAMIELLDRSVLADGERGREYLFGTIVSQLVPDEARMLAALATGRRFAVIDVLSRDGGRNGRTRPVLTNVSTLGAAAGVAVPDSTPTYLSRLQSFGLVEFGPPSDELSAQFDSLRGDASVRAARDEIDGGKSSSKVARKSVRMSPLGREFWQACAPPAPGKARRARR